MTDLDLARAIAIKAHVGQKYGDQPYFTHLDAVEAQCKLTYGDERTLVVAQLHDILEDTSTTEDILHHFFDKDIVEAVLAITHNDDEPREAYIARCKANQLARKVKIADSFCNLRESIARNDMKRIKKYGNQLAVLAS